MCSLQFSVFNPQFSVFNFQFTVLTPLNPHMSYENQSSYAKIGFFIVAGVTLIVGALIYIGGMESAKHEFPAETFFSDSVSGLDVGSAVNLRGVRVGTVKRISFIGAEYSDALLEDRKKIYVEMSFDRRLFRVGDERKPHQVVADMVKKGLHATVSASGVTGLSHIELNYPKGEIHEETSSWNPDHVIIPPAPSILQNAADSAQQILNQLNKMNFVEAWSNVLDVTRNASSALENFNVVLTGEQGNISEILGNVREASASLRDFANDVRNNPSSILRSYTPEQIDETR